MARVRKRFPHLAECFIIAGTFCSIPGPFPDPASAKGPEWILPEGGSAFCLSEWDFSSALDLCLGQAVLVSLKLPEPQLPGMKNKKKMVMCFDAEWPLCFNVDSKHFLLMVKATPSLSGIPAPFHLAVHCFSLS